MVTRERNARPSTDTAGTFARLVLVGLFTGVETVALAVWLAFVRDAPVVSRATAIGLGVLLVALFVEHFLADLAVNGLDLSFPAGKVALFSATETGLWGLWLAIAERVGGLEGVLVAGIVLAALLVPQHTVEDNVLRGRGLFSKLLAFGTVGFSVIEAAGATVWLVLVVRGDPVEPLLAEAGLTGADPALVGLGILAVALFVEHNVGVAFSRRA